MRATATIDPTFRIGPVRREVFGSFIEHLGRCVYTGVYEPGHASADANGFRTDVLELVRELGVTTVRYPGGSFVHAHRWEDGVGPRAQRPRRADLAWHSVEPNAFGLDEFILWCRRAGVEPMMAVNLGTRGLQEALDLLEYANLPGGTAWSDARRRNGAEAPHDIRVWCLGNEPDHRYTIGFSTAESYAQIAAQTARAYKMHDPDLQLVVAGSSGFASPTFGEWDRTVLEQTYDEVDMLSVHSYHWIEGDDLASFLGAPRQTDLLLDGVIATADAVGAARRSPKRIDIAFDEWNVWYLPRFKDQLPVGDDWPVAPRLLEDRYTVADAVVVGGMLNAILRHADRVRYANLAQLVNVIAPIVAEPDGPAWRQTTFHPFALASRFARGDALRVALESPAVDTPQWGAVDAVDVAATAADGEVAVFAINRSTSDACTLEIPVHGVVSLALVDAVTLSDPDPFRTASAEVEIAPAANASARVEGGRAVVELPPASWTLLRLAAE